MIDISRVKRTKGGRKVLLVTHYPQNNAYCKLIAHVEDEDGNVGTTFTYDDGKREHNGTTSELDLIVEPEEFKVCITESNLTALRDPASHTCRVNKNLPNYIPHRKFKLIEIV